MEFSRLFIAFNSEFYRFSKNCDDVAYILLLDTFAPASQDFGLEIFDDEFEPNDNHIRVIFGLLRDITEEERAFLLSFMESLLSFKPSIDYRVEYVEVVNELEFDYPEEKGFVQLVNQVNSLFDVTIQITDYSSFNNLIQN